MEFKRQNRPGGQPEPTISRRNGPAVPSVSDAHQEQAPPSPSRIRRFLSSKPIIVSLLFIGCLVIGLVAWNFIKSTAVAKEPKYETVLPKEKAVNELGGWKRISPPGKEPVFAFADTIDGIAVSVSQQPLPQQFKEDLDNQVAGLAQRFNATEKINAGGTTIYVGTSSKGPQSAIFAKTDLLILIKSEKKVSTNSWANYVQALR